MKILFELKHTYTEMDEDYQNYLTIFEDGSIKVYQMQTYCYEPESKYIDKTANSDLHTEIINLFNLHKKEIEEIPFTENAPHWSFNLQVLDKKFSLLFLSRWHETDYMGNKKIKTQEDISTDFLIELICSIKNILEKYYPNEIDWKRFDREHWFKN